MLFVPKGLTPNAISTPLFFGYWNLSTEKKPEQMLKSSFRMELFTSHKTQELYFA